MEEKEIPIPKIKKKYLIADILGDYVSNSHKKNNKDMINQVVDTFDIYNKGASRKENNRSGKQRNKSLTPSIDELNGNFAVVKADIEGFGELMEAGQHTMVKAKLKDLVSKHCIGFLYAAALEGDSISVAHTSAEDVLIAMKRISYDLASLPSHPLLRIAIDFGKIDHSEQTIIKTVARIEPKVTPGEIWITERVKVMLPKEYKDTIENIGEKQINKKKEKPKFENLYKVNFPNLI
jgi:hypothetical protein